MELVRAASLTGYFEVAEELGLNTVPLLRRAGIRRSMLRNPEQPVPARPVFFLLEQSAEVSGCPTFGLRMVEHRRVGDVGLLSVLFAHQPTLGAALAVLEEYRHRLNPVLLYQREHLDGRILMAAKFLLQPAVPTRQAGDIALGVINQVLRSVFPAGWRPVSVRFPYTQPPRSELSVYERLFACPVEFGAETGGILFEAADLDAANPHSDPIMAAHARRMIEAMLDPSERSTIEEVEATVLMLMPQQRASITAVADGLGIPTRTLQRRLELEGTRFSEVLGSARAREVGKHLANPKLSMNDVAERLGFSSQASFSRWYRGQFNQTPSAARNAHRH